MMICNVFHVYVTYVQSDGHMSKRFALWRLPPVLVVHLKRFQFDSTNRRKLTNKVDFPLDGLDLKRYIASTRWDHLVVQGKNVEKDVTNNCETANGLHKSKIDECTNRKENENRFLFLKALLWHRLK